eukprot:XP_019923927.1 PREDICTED: uncharacterized protein LOC105330903 [Crassostrea gigas]
MSFFLSTNQKTEYNSSLCLTITQYLLNYLQEESYDSSYTSPILQVIERLMASKCQNNEGVQQLLSVLVSRFTWIHDLSKEKKLLLQFFSRVVTENEEMFIREDTKRAFLELLPALFRSCVRNPVMSGQIMEVLRNLACRTTNTNSTEVSVFVYSVLVQSDNCDQPATQVHFLGVLSEKGDGDEDEEEEGGEVEEGADQLELPGVVVAEERIVQENNTGGMLQLLHSKRGRGICK